MAGVPTLEEFREEVVGFLDANAQARPAEDENRPFKWGEGSDKVAIFDEIDPDEERAALAKAKEWRAKRYDAGLAWITGPIPYGGRELPSAYDDLYSSLERSYLAPSQAFFGIGLAMVVPTILGHGTDELKERWLPPLVRGDLVGCQLFSEPGAGSDLASLQTRAVRDGDEWLVTGQKVWTSNAHFSDVGEIICRTNPDAPKHRGLTGFIVDMHAPGVEVRPLRQMTGGTSFNEVFFDEVRVPDANRLGDVDGGWSVALTTLMNERAAIGGGMGTSMSSGGASRNTVSRIRELCQQTGVEDDPIVRDRLADAYIRFRTAQLTNERVMARVLSGQAPGPELSIAKLALTSNLWRAVNLVEEILGPRAAADTGEWGTYAWTQLFLGLPGLKIAGGSDEVLRNVIAERVLGMPKDPGIDSSVPFKDLLVGTQDT